MTATELFNYAGNTGKKYDSLSGHELFLKRLAVFHANPVLFTENPSLATDESGIRFEVDKRRITVLTDILKNTTWPALGSKTWPTLPEFNGLAESPPRLTSEEEKGYKYIQMHNIANQLISDFRDGIELDENDPENFVDPFYLEQHGLKITKHGEHGEESYLTLNDDHRKQILQAVESVAMQGHPEIQIDYAVLAMHFISPGISPEMGNDDKKFYLSKAIKYMEAGLKNEGQEYVSDSGKEMREMYAEDLQEMRQQLQQLKTQGYAAPTKNI